jgi:hypothetical protein
MTHQPGCLTSCCVGLHTHTMHFKEQCVPVPMMCLSGFHATCLNMSRLKHSTRFYHRRQLGTCALDQVRAGCKTDSMAEGRKTECQLCMACAT